MLVTLTRYLVANRVIAEIPGRRLRLLGPVPHKARSLLRDFDRLLKIKIELKSHSITCFCMLYVSTS